MQTSSQNRFDNFCHSISSIEPRIVFSPYCAEKATRIRKSRDTFATPSTCLSVYRHVQRHYVRKPIRLTPPQTYTHRHTESESVFPVRSFPFEKALFAAAANISPHSFFRDFCGESCVSYPFLLAPRFVGALSPHTRPTATFMSVCSLGLLKTFKICWFFSYLESRPTTTTARTTTTTMIMCSNLRLLTQLPNHCHLYGVGLSAER